MQSMDGQLTVYEHESVAFSRFLHNFLLPGPLCYAGGMDSFITCNSSFEVECYKYQVLASSSGAEVKMDPGHESELTAQKKVQVDWKFVLGEAALDIQVARFSRLVGGNGLDVLVLSEHMLLALSEMGEIRTQIRLDFIPTALTVYQVRLPRSTGAPLGERSLRSCNRGVSICVHPYRALTLLRLAVAGDRRWRRSMAARFTTPSWRARQAPR